MKTWFSDPSDTSLLDLLPLLIDMATLEVDDVTLALSTYRCEVLRRIEAGVPDPHVDLRLSELFRET